MLVGQYPVQVQANFILRQLQDIKNGIYNEIKDVHYPTVLQTKNDQRRNRLNGLATLGLDKTR